jgi:imidazole glycerol-phosphate synthase subunit HisH
VIAILDYGFGNLRSVQRAVERVGGRPEITRDPGVVGGAEALIVPGVGAFGACVGSLRSTGLDRVVRDFAATGRPLVGICLGMQVLFDWGEEGAVDGLGLLRGKVRRLPEGLTVPHMGWNEVAWTREHPLVGGVASGSRFYFVHSYVCEPEEQGVTLGETEYGVSFPAVVARENVFATQFHPEKSGMTGLKILSNFVRLADRVAQAA